MRLLLFVSLIAFASLAELPGAYAQEDHKNAKKIVFIAGNPSHGYGSHEHYAGCRKLAQTIQSRGLNVECEVVANGWPKDESVLNDADAIVIYSDGGGGHPALAHLDKLNSLMEEKVGLVCLHYAVEVPKDRGGKEFLQWLGGYFETDWSVNPHWTAEFTSLPQHPIASGVQPFAANDEWYFHMRFADQQNKLTPILTAVPPESTMSRPDGSHSGNPTVRKAVAKREPQHMAWAFERANGGRSFGFTGGHYHWNWGRQEISQLVTNAIIWTAGLDPASTSKPTVPSSVAELAQGQDEDIPTSFNAKAVHEEFKIPLDVVMVAGQAKPIAKEGGSQNSVSSKAAYQSPLITTQTPQHQVNISVPLNNAKKIYLVVTDGGDSYSCDWADWIDPVFINAKGEKTSLTNLKWNNATSDWGQVQVNRNVNGAPLQIKAQLSNEASVRTQTV